MTRNVSGGGEAIGNESLGKPQAETYDQPRHEPSKDKAVDGEHPPAVGALDDPLWNCNDVLALARAVRVAVQLEIFADGLIGERLVGLGELDKLVVDVLARFIRAELDFIRVADEGLLEGLARQRTG